MTARAKLTDAQIAEIRAIAEADPAVSRKELGRRFGVHHATISRLIAGKAHADPASPAEASAPRDDAPSPLRMIPWGRIAPNPRNVRSVESEQGEAAEAALLDLAASILDRGVLQPLRVEPLDRPDPVDGAEVVVVDGHRRWRALRQLVREHAIEPDYPVPCLLAAPASAAGLALDQLAANLARRDMHPLDEAEAFRRVVDAGRTTEQIAAAVGRTRRHVQTRLALGRRLGDAAKRAMRDGDISLAQAEALCDADAGQQDHVLRQIHRFKTEQSIRDFLRPEKNASVDPGREEPLPSVSEMLGSVDLDGVATAEQADVPQKQDLERERRSPGALPTADSEAPPFTPGPANDTAGSAFPPFRHFRVLAADPDDDNMPRTLTLENVVTNRRADYIRDPLDIPDFLRRSDDATSPQRTNGGDDGGR